LGHLIRYNPARVVPNPQIPSAPPRSLKLEIQQHGDQLAHPALDLIAARPDRFTRQGYVVATYRRRNGRTFGPYYALRYRDNGRAFSVYLGPAGPLVERVRQALAVVQQSLRQRCTFRRITRSIRTALRTHRLRVGNLLRPLGLYLKGYEVRGWRLSPIRSLLPRRRRLALRIPTCRKTSRTRPVNDPASRLLRFLEARDGPPIVTP
jgi:hypothetical protein